MKKRFLLILFAAMAAVGARGGSAYLKLKSVTPAKGLVYVSTTDKAPSTNQYQQYSPGGAAEGVGNETCYTEGDNKGKGIRYSWAKPARGYKIVKGDAWSGYATNFSSGNASPTNEPSPIYEYYTEDTPENWDGESDHIRACAGGRQDTYVTVSPKFVAADGFDVKYKPAQGGAFNVKYSYEKTRQKEDGEYEFYTLNEDYDVTLMGGSITPTGNQSPANIYSYATDVVTLHSSAPNFICWIENGSEKSKENPYTYSITGDATVSAIFKWAEFGVVSGDLAPQVSELASNSLSIEIPVITTGVWTSDDFTITFSEKTELINGYIVGGDATYSNGILTIPYIYTPESYGLTDVEVKVAPVYGESVTFQIRAKATEIVNYEACVIDGGKMVDTGTLSAMIAKANTLDSKPTVQLMANVNMDSPLSITKSLILNLNDHQLVGQGSAIISIDADNIDVQIIDGTSKLGVLRVNSASDKVVSVVSFTKKAKLMLSGGTIEVGNVGTGPAYGVNIQNGSTFYMTGGIINVQAKEDARGVNVATIDDYATFLGGGVYVFAQNKAYGLWSAGQSNIANTEISVETTNIEAYGMYVNGGVATLDGTAVSANSGMSKAYGVFVNQGRLNSNGGRITATALFSEVYGMHIEKNGIAVVQQNTTIVANATDATGTLVYGVNNKGSVKMSNVSLNIAAKTTDVIAVNTADGALSTTIEGGTYVANGIGGRVYGLCHRDGILNVNGGIFKSISCGEYAYGGYVAEYATLANATFWGETQDDGNMAYGFYANAKGKDISLTSCGIVGKSSTTKAYALFSIANLTASNCTLSSQAMESAAYGLWVEDGNNVLKRCTMNVYSYTTGAYGVFQKGGLVDIEDGEYTITAVQNSATSIQNAELYGIKNSNVSRILLRNAVFTINASNDSWSQQAYGIYAEGVVDSKACGFSVSVGKSAYGIYGKGGYSNLSLLGNTITTRANRGSNSYGIYAEKNFYINGDVVNAFSTGTATYAIYLKNSAVGEVVDGKFGAMGNNTTDFGCINNMASIANVKLKGGIYKINTNLKHYVAEGVEVYNLDRKHLEFANGYRFMIAAQSPNSAVCKIINGNSYVTLEEALQYTKDNVGSYTILMLQSYVLPAGNYTLPADVVLIVPYEVEQVEAMGETPQKRNTRGVSTEYVCLTLSDGVNLSVDGTIEVSGEMFCQQTGLTGYNAGPYGRIHLNDGSHVLLNKGSKLYAWGFVTGNGDITAKSASEVHEFFQIGDMKTVSSLFYVYVGSSSKNNEKFFPISQYYIQNIEAPVTYYKGASLCCAMGIYYNGKYSGDDNVKIIGTSESLFLMDVSDEYAWVRKRYDSAKDQQIWEINTSAQIGSITMSIDNPIFSGKISIKSANYILPVCSNWKMKILDGDCTFTQDMELLPGAELEVNKTAAITLKEGKSLYVFDKDQWPFSYPTAAFSPSWPNGKRPERIINDAKINVHGSVNLLSNSKLYTTRDYKNRISTTSLTFGANIYSTNADAGAINFTSAAPSDNATLALIIGTKDNKAVDTIVVVNPALLKNGEQFEPQYTETAGVRAGHSVIYKNDHWYDTDQDGCFTVIDDIYYAKPSEFVALSDNIPNQDHIYTTVEGKSLILQTNDCQWWEVEKTKTIGVYECKKAGYEGFYRYNEGTNCWEIETILVDFYADEERLSKLKTITTNYMGVPDQSVIVSTLTKAPTAEFTYEFYGWKSSATGAVYSVTSKLEPAESNMYYTPVFIEKKRNYTITLRDANNGATVSLEVPYEETPAYTAVKVADVQYTYTFDRWEPEFVPVVGKATYTAKWKYTTNTYTIVWQNGDEILQKDIEQPYGESTVYRGVLPTKETDEDFKYEFSGWKDSQTARIYANGETPTVGDATIYIAQYNTIPRYAVSFINYNGEELTKTIYTKGETPIYEGAIPTRKRDADGYYVFRGWKNSNNMEFAVDEVLPIVDAKEIYTAQYNYVTELYPITLKNVDGNDAVWSGTFGVGAMPFYNKNNDDIPVVPTKMEDEYCTYIFGGWNPDLKSVSGPATYTAIFDKIPKTIGTPLDIVDWTENTLTINTTGFVPQWPYTINGTEFQLKNGGLNSDRTATIPYTGNPGEEVWIAAVNKSGVVMSQHKYRIPHIYSENTTLSTETDALNEKSVIFVKDNAVLTIASSVRVSAIYVAPGAELVVSEGATLTVDSLMLRTTPWEAAILENQGTISANKVYYTRIVSDRAYHQFALPLESKIADARLSNGATFPYAKTWLLKRYDEPSRAENGAGASSNWKEVATGERIEATKGYELYSGSAYYREIYFPVTLPDPDPTQSPKEVSVSYTKEEGDAGPAHRGWNALCSPLLGRSTPLVASTNQPSEQLFKVSILTEAGNYYQDALSVINPAVPFYYQASEAGTTLRFSSVSSSTVKAAPQRIWDTSVSEQWLRLTIHNAAGTMLDVTNIFVHPEKFLADYEPGYDVAKQSLTASTAVLYSSWPCGPLAFAAIPDSVAADRIPLTVSAGKAGEYTFSLQDNNYLERLDHVFLYDAETGAVTDLLGDDYTIALPQGTAAGRFYIRCVFAPVSDITTDIVPDGTEDMQTNHVQKFLYNDRVYILRNGVFYDLTGRPCELQ